MTSRRRTETPAAPMEAGGSRSVEVPVRHALEAALGYAFERQELLVLALTHRSSAYEARGGPPEDTLFPKHKNPPGTDNEQLEFLGDAILGLVVSEALYRDFPASSEGELTRLRSHLVSRKRMAAVGEALGLAEHLLLGKSAEQNGGRDKPALLANAAEAVIAAMYIDAGTAGLEVVGRLIQKHLIAPELVPMRAALAAANGRGALRDHKTLLQEKVQALGQTAIRPAAPSRLRYVDVAQSGPPHQRVFSVEAQLEGPEGTRTLAAGDGPSKKEAQQRAAELALLAWGEE